MEKIEIQIFFMKPTYLKSKKCGSITEKKKIIWHDWLSNVIFFLILMIMGDEWCKTVKVKKIKWWWQLTARIMEELPKRWVRKKNDYKDSLF